MKKPLLFLSISIVFTTLCWGQDKMLTLDDVVSGGSHYSNLKPHSPKQLQWANKDNISFVKEDTVIVSQSISGKQNNLISIKDLKKIAPEYHGEKIPRHYWHQDRTIEFRLDKERLFYNLKDHTTQSIKYPKEAENLDLHFESKRLAYTIGNRLYFATLTDQQLSIADEADTGIVCGQTVHRSEFGIRKGTFWSPDGNSLAFYRKDESMVSDYPLVDLISGAATTKTIKYPMAGTTNERVKVGVMNFLTGKITYLKTDESDHYLTNITWSPDGSEIYIAEVNRAQNHMDLNYYNATTGEQVRRVFSEKNEKYIEPESPLYFVPNAPNQFLWLSRRDGYKHLYLYTTEGTLVKQLTKGDWEVTKVLGFDNKGKNIIITTTAQSYLERNTYIVNLDNGQMSNLTPNKGCHYSKLSPEGDFILDTWSAIATPSVSDIITIKNSKLKNIATAQNPYKDYKLGRMELFTIASSDSVTELSCRMIYPPNFDKNKKYPVIIYVYGGPHSQMIKNCWQGGVQMWQHYMAQKGYLMFTLDNRGTSFRGAKFEQIIHRELGKYEMQDQMKGYDYLVSKPYVDASRMGVFGWSYGGFMTTSLMTHYPKAFKVGVAGGPVIDWSNYEIMYGERYMDTPNENPQGYSNTNLTNYAHKLEGRLLMIHGAQDPVVVWQHSQKFVHQCIKEGVQLDYFVYPTHEHNVRGKDRVHLMDKITRHFDDNL